jgi:hypothetical protein
VVLDLDLDVVEGHDENVCRPRFLIIRGDDDEPCFPGLERRAVVTLDQCEGLHLFEVEQRNERGLEPDGALMRRVSSRDSTCFHG